MSNNQNCTNMNHSRLNTPVRFCTSCGVELNKKINLSCNDQMHRESRKNRNLFCHACGLKFSNMKG